jgi:hypothetical protein
MGMPAATDHLKPAVLGDLQHWSHEIEDLASIQLHRFAFQRFTAMLAAPGNRVVHNSVWQLSALQRTPAVSGLPAWFTTAGLTQRFGFLAKYVCRGRLTRVVTVFT